MDNNNQIPPVQSMPHPSVGGGMPDNEVSRILMSQGSLPPNGMAQSPVVQGGVNNSYNMGGAYLAADTQMNASANNNANINANVNAGFQNPQAVQSLAPDGRPMMQQPQMAPVEPKKKKNVASLVKTIAIIALSLVSVTFIGLFVWMTNQYNTEKDRDLDSEIKAAVAKSQDELTTKMEGEFLAREKYPYKTFYGPADYGELTFEYPKTWSVYVAAAATDGGDFNAYFNPIQVDAVGENTINALRVTIRNKSFDEVTAEYQKAMEKKDSNLTVEAVTVAGVAANRYTGTIPRTELSGYIVVFKIRDKTVIMQTDSVVFKDDFDKLLDTVSFSA